MALVTVSGPWTTVAGKPLGPSAWVRLAHAERIATTPDGVVGGRSPVEINDESATVQLEAEFDDPSVRYELTIAGSSVDSVERLVYTLPVPTANISWRDWLAQSLAVRSYVPTEAERLRDQMNYLAAQAVWTENTKAQLELRGLYDHMAAGLNTNVVVFGSSTPEGVFLSDPHNERWTRKAEVALRSRFGHADDSTGFVDAAYSFVWTPENMTRGGTVTEQSWVWGIDGSAAVLDGPSEAFVQASGTGSVLRVWYGKRGVNGCSARVFVDGVDVTASGTLSTGSSSGATISGQVSPLGAHEGGFWWEYTTTPGPHTVKVMASGGSGTSFPLEGIEFRNAGPSIRFYNGGHAGARFRHWTDKTFAGVSTIDPMWKTAAAIGPHLVVTQMLANDEGMSNPEALKADVTDWLVRLRSSVSATVPVLVVIPFMPGGRDPGQWAEFRQALIDGAASDAYTTVWDQAEHWPALMADGSTNGGLMVESTNPTHPNAAGHAKIAADFTDLLSAPVVLGGAVRTVNGISPDADGNVLVAAVAPTDAQVAALVADPQSQTGGELSATYVAATIAAGAGFDPSGAGDSRNALQAKLDAVAAFTSGGEVVVPRGTYCLASPLYARSNVTLRLQAGARLEFTTAGGPFLRNQDFAVKLSRFRIVGPGSIGAASHAVTGQVIFLHGDDLTLDGFTIDTYAGGQAILIGGDRNHLSGLTIVNPLDAPGVGGIRMYGGSHFRAIGCHVVAGDDALQFTPIASAEPAACRNQSISDSAYIGCTGGSTEARFMVVALSTSPPGLGGLTNSTSNVSFIGCHGYGQKRGALIANTDSTGEIASVGFLDCSLDMTGATAMTQDVRIERSVGTGRVRGIRFNGFRIKNPAAAAIGTTGDATASTFVEDVALVDCLLDAAPSGATVSPSAVDGFIMRGGRIDGNGAGYLVQGGTGVNASRNLTFDGVRFAGIGDGWAGVRLAETVNHRVTNCIFTPQAGSTTAAAVSLAAGVSRGIITDNDATTIPGATVAGTITAGTVVRDNFE